MSELRRLTLPMPRLGETMEEGTIAEWLVQPGESFKRGDPLLEVETDKTMVDFPALGDGMMVDMLVASGDVIEVGKPIAVIETQDAWEGMQSAPDTEAAPQSLPQTASPPGAATKPPTATMRPRATPLARRIAHQNGIAIDQLAGTGRRGRIEAEDVKVLIDSAASAPATIRTANAGAHPVYCVHGLGGLGSNWAALRASLQNTGINSVAPDLPGHGRNPIDATDVETLVDWLEADLKQQPAPVHLVAHSLGAHVATLAALRDPSLVSRLTLIAPAGCGIDINGAFLSGMAAAPDAGELSHLMRLLGSKAAKLDTKALSSMAHDLHGQRLTALVHEVVRGDVQRIDTIAPLRALTGRLPVRAIFGLGDRIIPKEHLFNLPSAVACHMVEAGHMPHWDATEEVARIITAQ